MSRYIDADALIEEINSLSVTLCGKELFGELAKHSVVQKINEAPDTDVVEVVRCKDCAHYHEMKGFDYKGRKAHHCVWHSALRGENDYCSDGLRREKCEIGY